jgi:hypothetical protein
VDINIHDEARINIDLKANELLLKIEQFQKLNIPKYNTPPVGLSIEINEDDIKYIELENGFMMVNQNAIYGIKNNYSEYVDLIERILKAFKSKVSYKYIDQKLKEWIKKRVETNIDLKITEFLVEEISKDTKEYNVFIPIFLTQLEKEFEFGKVKFITFSEDIIEDIIKSTDHDSEQLKTELKKKYCNYAVGVQTITGEPYSVKEVAFENISNSLSMLRLFSPANIDINKITAVYEKGHGCYESEKYLITGVNHCSYSEGAINEGLYTVMPIDFIDIITSSQYEGLHFLLNNELNSFQKELLIILKIYSKHSLKYDIFDKLLYLFSALERAFIKDGNESLQQNLSERIAFYIGENLDQRKKIIKIIKDAYQIRSRGVHHGHIIIDDVTTMNNLLILAWRVFEKMIYEYNKYESIKQFIGTIDDKKLS